MNDRELSEILGKLCKFTLKTFLMSSRNGPFEKLEGDA